MGVSKILFIYVYVDILAFVLGTVFGSFINCMAWRIVHGESVLKGRSHCAVCGHVLKAADLVPVISYLVCRGKCRYCGEKISPRYPLTELLTGAAFLGAELRFPLSFQAVRVMVLSCILLGLSLVDLDSYEIPDRFPAAGILWWAATVPFMDKPWTLQLKEGLTGAAVIAGGLLLLSLLFDKITGKESLGGGDIKLLFMLDLYLGPWVGLFHLILACLTGLLFVAVRRQKKIPFGPAISLAGYFCLLFGDAFLQWYLGLLV
ncbi:MAG: prepilin peptidase [Bilifractor porci]|jgi:leader peptidase (prepilin peptidase)/N-methyltransferase